MPSSAVHLHPLFRPEPRNDSAQIGQLLPDGTGVICLLVLEKEQAPIQHSIRRSILGVNQQAREGRDLPAGTVTMWLRDNNDHWTLNVVVPAGFGWCRGAYLLNCLINGELVRRVIEVPAGPFDTTNECCDTHASFVVCDREATRVAFSTGHIGQPRIALQDMNGAPYTEVGMRLYESNAEWVVDFSTPLTRACRLYWVVVGCR